ncbi:unnamed protein product [Mytilus coruscus]|uniref:Uncharacterized protein n=1 Tax=Mytilus coruscus TaxID=42192 RepID=A0A6J8APU4_MYTCO|nr:unnamed protein product [Mytilus coruscus]
MRQKQQGRIYRLLTTNKQIPTSTYNTSTIIGTSTVKPSKKNSQPASQSSSVQTVPSTSTTSMTHTSKMNFTKSSTGQFSTSNSSVTNKPLLTKSSSKQSVGSTTTQQHSITGTTITGQPTTITTSKDRVKESTTNLHSTSQTTTSARPVTNLSPASSGRVKEVTTNIYSTSQSTTGTTHSSTMSFTTILTTSTSTLQTTSKKVLTDNQSPKMTTSSKPKLTQSTPNPDATKKVGVHATLQFKGVVNGNGNGKTMNEILTGITNLLQDKSCKKVEVEYLNKQEDMSDKTTSVSVRVKCDRTYLTTEMLNDKFKNIPEKDLKATFPLPMITKTETKPQTSDKSWASSNWQILVGVLVGASVVIVAFIVAKKYFTKRRSYDVRILDDCDYELDNQLNKGTKFTNFD